MCDENDTNAIMLVSTEHKTKSFYFLYFHNFWEIRMWSFDFRFLQILGIQPVHGSDWYRQRRSFSNVRKIKEVFAERDTEPGDGRGLGLGPKIGSSREYIRRPDRIG